MGQLLMSGLAMGCIYALGSLGFVITHKSVGILNFAYGEMVTFGAYFAFTVFAAFKLPLPLGSLLLAAGLVLMGLFFSFAIYKPLRLKPARTVVIATLGVSIAMQALALLIWGPYPKRLPTMVSSEPIFAGSIVILPHNLFILIVTAISVVFLYVLYGKTSLGWKMQAIAQNAETARLMGIHVERIITFTWILSSGFGGLAGFLVAPLFFINASMGFTVMLKAFAACIIGGFGNFEGAIVGGLFVGLAEALLAGYFSSAYKDVLTFALLIIVLIVLPRGFFGEKIGEKV
jgi:branched-chain amino acid transport system permease protein